MKKDIFYLQEIQESCNNGKGKRDSESSNLNAIAKTEIKNGAAGDGIC